LSPLLAIESLDVGFNATEGRAASAVRDLSFDVERGETVALVGESGCGKSVTALALMGLLPAEARVRGRIRFDGELDLLTLEERAWRRLRGRRLGMVFQEPAAALNPVLSVGSQIVEALRAHRPLSKRAALIEAERLLERVAMPDPARRLGSYPHQLSGGQRQRVMLAIALACGPDLLIADEPTTALDVTVQAQVVELLRRLRRELGLTILLITHDLALVAETCDRVLVMYAGELVEEAPIEELFSEPAHPYTRALLEALPRPGSGELPRAIPGRVPEPENRPPGCTFAPRCPRAWELCHERAPESFGLGSGRSARCWLHRGEEAG